MAILVALAIVPDFALAAGAARDDGYGPSLAKRSPKRVGVIAFVVGERMDPGRPAATRAADRLRLSPFLPPNAARCAFTYVLSIAVLLVTAPASTSASSNLSQKPRADHRLNRL